MRPLLPDVLRTNAQFRRMWTASSISMFGSQLTFYALPIATYQLSGSGRIFATVMIASTAGLLLSSLIGGAFIDRFDRQRLQLLSNGLLAPIVVAMGIGVQQHAWTALVVLAFVQNTVRALFRSSDALRRDIVDTDDRLAANAISQASIYATSVISPLVGVALLAWFGFAAVAALDVLTFLASFVLLLGVRDPAQRTVTKMTLRANAHRTVVDVRDGIVLARRDRFLRLTMSIDMAFGFAHGWALVGMIPWLHDVHGVDATWYGSIVTVAAASGLIASLAMARFGSHIAPGRAVRWGVIIGTAALLAYVGVQPLWFILVCGALAAVEGALTMTSISTVLQDRFPSEVQGRISAVNFMLFQVAFLVGLSGAGLLTGHVASATIMYIYIGCALVTAALMWRIPHAMQSPIAELDRDVVTDSDLATSG